MKSFYRIIIFLFKVSFIYDVCCVCSTTLKKKYVISSLACLFINALYLVTSVFKLMELPENQCVPCYVFKRTIHFVFRCYVTIKFRKYLTIMNILSKLKFKNFKELERKIVFWMVENVLFHFIMCTLSMWVTYKINAEIEVDGVISNSTSNFYLLEQITPFLHDFFTFFLAYISFTTFCMFYSATCTELCSMLHNFKVLIQSENIPNYEHYLRTFISIKSVIKDTDSAVSTPISLYLVYISVRFYNIYFICFHDFLESFLFRVVFILQIAHDVYSFVEVYLAALSVSRTACEIAEYVPSLIVLRPSDRELSDILLLINTDKEIHMTIIGGLAIKKFFLLIYIFTMFSFFALIDFSGYLGYL